MPLSLEFASGDLSRAGVDVIALFIGERAPAKNPWLVAVDRALGGGLIAHAKQSDFTGKPEQSLEVPTFGRLKARRILLVGAGKNIDSPRVRNMVAATVRAASSLGARSLALALPESLDLRAVGEGASLGAYRFAKYFTGKRRPKTELRRILVWSPGRPNAADKKALSIGKSVAGAVCLARDAVNEPPNELVPETLAQIARRIAREHRFKIKVLARPPVPGRARAGAPNGGTRAARRPARSRRGRTLRRSRSSSSSFAHPPWVARVLAL
jgi:leucyl aminopeptidase